MNAEEYLKGLNEHDPVFEIDTEYEFTEQQLINFAERYHEKQLKLLRIGGVVSSLKKICTDLNLDTEEVLLEYDKKLNGFEVLYDEGIEQTFYVRKGFIQL